MSLTNPNTPVSQQDLQDFYHRILPYLGGSNEGGSGHTIEDAEGTELTQRDTLQFGEGLLATDDPTNEKTVVDIDSMSAEDMDEIINELPTGGNIAVTGYVPLGTLISFYGETAPKFFLACDGSTYNKADYPELANHLLSLTNNTSYIVDGDNTKFKVPDLRGEFLRGTGTNSHANNGNGANVGVHQDGTLMPIIAVDSSNQNLAIHTNAPQHANIDYKTISSNKTGAWYQRSGTFSASGEQSFAARPTNTSVLFCIAYKDIYSNPMNDYSTTEKVVGTWIDGKPIYQKTFVIDGSLEFTANTWLSTIIVIDDGEAIIDAELVDRPPNSMARAQIWGVLNSSTKVVSLLMSRTNNYPYGAYITFRYTKTTD